MSYQEPLSQQAIAIAVSDSADMAGLGLAPEHLQDAMAEIARHLLAMGARLIYGGDLRANGFTELLFELVARHRRDADVGDTRPAVLNFLAWPIVVSKTPADLHRLAKDLRGLAELRFLDREGRDIAAGALDGVSRQVLTDEDWVMSLTAMRHSLTVVSDARIVLGGRTEGFKGSMPGIAEEALTALQVGQPLFLLGGFGGCARDIASLIGALPAAASFQPQWPSAALFLKFNPSALHNGLSEDENRTLVRTVHIDQAVGLILRGLLRLTKSGPRA
jgi:hypothetical protein